MRSIQRALRFASIILAIVVAAVPAPALAASGKPDVVHQQFATTGADLGVINICGDLADFAFSTEGSFTSVDMGDGVFHFQVVSRGTYTVTFLDTSKGVWEATIRSVDQRPGDSGRHVHGRRRSPTHSKVRSGSTSGPRSSSMATAPSTWITPTSMSWAVRRHRADDVTST